MTPRWKIVGADWSEDVPVVCNLANSNRCRKVGLTLTPHREPKPPGGHLLPPTSQPSIFVTKRRWVCLTRSCQWMVKCYEGAMISYSHVSQCLARGVQLTFPHSLGIKQATVLPLGPSVCTQYSGKRLPSEVTHTSKPLKNMASSTIRPQGHFRVALVATETDETDKGRREKMY